MTLDIHNISDLPVIINSIDLNNGKTLNGFISDSKVAAKSKKTIEFYLKDSFSNAFVSKKNKEGGFRYPKDLKKIKVNYQTAGLTHKRLQEITPFDLKVDDNFISEYRNSFRTNFNTADFISVNLKKKEIRFNSGTYSISNTVIIPKGYTVIVEKGFNLDLQENTSLISYSPIICNGTKEAPIKFFSSNSDAQGVFVTNTPLKSKLNYCQFINLSNPIIGNWQLSGAVNFHEANVDISNSIFKNNRCEDGLNIIRSTFTLNKSTFENTYSDAFDGDFVKGKISNCSFLNSGNDGIDVSGSTLELLNIDLENPSDKAISGGEASNITGENINIVGGEIGLVSKDLSRISITQINMTDTRLAFSCFQKKSEYGPGFINVKKSKLSNVELPHLVETNSDLVIDDVWVDVKLDNVTEKMYGNEYGKSSK